MSRPLSDCPAMLRVLRALDAWGRPVRPLTLADCPAMLRVLRAPRDPDGRRPRRVGGPVTRPSPAVAGIYLYCTIAPLVAFVVLFTAACN